MRSKTLDKEDIEAVIKALRTQKRTQVELNLLMCDLEDKYEFSCEAGDGIDLAKGVITYARNNNEIKPVDPQ